MTVIRAYPNYTLYNLMILYDAKEQLLTSLVCLDSLFFKPFFLK